MVMTPVTALADEAEAPSETQTTEAAEENEEKTEEPEVVEDKGEPEEAQRDAEDATLAKGKCGKKVKWNLSKKGTLKITGKGAMYNYKIVNVTAPTSLLEMNSTAPWSKHKDKIKKVVISKGVTTVGDFAFLASPNLTSVSLPKSLKKINQGAFVFCVKLSKISIPKKVKSIGLGAFGMCVGLVSVSLPKGLTSIGDSAFLATGLKSVVIPKGVKEIGSSVFGGCGSLATVKFSSGLKTIGNGAFNGCSKLSAVTIPASVKTIGDSAFADCSSLVTVNIPISGLSTMGEKAFEGCTSLKSFKVPLSVTKLGSFAFNNCTSLEEAWISSKLDAASTGTFNGCSKLDGGNPKYYNYADINEEITDEGPFHYKVTNPEINGNGTVTVTEYDPAAEKIVIPNVVVYKGVSYKVARIERNKAVAENTTLKTVVIGSNVTSIADDAFSGCTALESVTGGAKLQTIGANAFANCPKLKVFNISSKSLKKIGASAFSGDTALTTLQLKKTTKLTKSGVKKSLAGSAVKTVKVKKSKVKKYKKIFKKKNCGKKVKVKK